MRSWRFEELRKSYGEDIVIESREFSSSFSRAREIAQERATVEEDRKLEYR
jgi:hypothetical protein